MKVNLIVDTHALVWWWQSSPRLTHAASTAIGDRANEILVSAASIYEFTAKFRSGKWPEVASVVEEFEGHMERSGFGGLDVTPMHARAAGLLPGPHRDPFDRLLIAQAKIENAIIVTADPVFSSYGITTIW